MTTAQLLPLLNVLWGLLIGLIIFLGKYMWDMVHNLIQKVTKMELESAKEHVTKGMLDEALIKFGREYISPIAKDTKVIMRTLDDKGIHVPRHTD